MSDPVTDNNAGKPSDKFWSADRGWSVARLPLHILLVGLSILLLAWLSSRIYVPLFNHLFAALSDTHGPANPDQHPVLQTIVALLGRHANEGMVCVATRARLRGNRRPRVRGNRQPRLRGNRRRLF